MKPQYFSENIRNFRHAKGLSQRDLGLLLGVSMQAVSKWENGLAYPDIFLLPVIAQTIGVTIDELLMTHIALWQRKP